MSLVLVWGFEPRSYPQLLSSNGGVNTGQALWEMGSGRHRGVRNQSQNPSSPWEGLARKGQRIHGSFGRIVAPSFMKSTVPRVGLSFRW